MIDREARDVAVTALRDFMEGAISNREYERKYPTSERDPALWAIYSQIWFHYSDISEHTLTGKHQLNVDGQRLLERCLLFLRSDLEYLWPPQKLRLWHGILRLLGLGRIMKRGKTDEATLYDAGVWPFFDTAQRNQTASLAHER